MLGIELFDFKEKQTQLNAIVGLPLSIARKAADMRGFHFGKITSSGKRSWGEFALHIQCAWRVEGPDGIVTGSVDLWEPQNEEDDLEDWHYATHENLQDWKLREFLGSYDDKTHSAVNLSQNLIVESVEIKDFGDLIIKLSGGGQIVTFIDGTRGEKWRLFAPNKDDPHLCMIY